MKAVQAVLNWEAVFACQCFIHETALLRGLALLPVVMVGIWERAQQRGLGPHHPPFERCGEGGVFPSPNSFLRGAR